MNDVALLASIAEILQRKGLDLSPNQNIFRLIWDLEAEVNNGGFNQYFFNNSGRNAPYVPVALTAIGASECARIVAQAVALVENRSFNWQDDLARQEQLETVDPEIEAFSELESRFCEDPDNLSALLATFVKAHPTDFEAIAS